MSSLQHHAQRGMSLVELLIGIALGLFVVAAAATLLASQWREQRSLATQNRLMQDLRTASDVIARDLRRAGHWAAATSGLPAPGASAVRANPYAAMTPASAASDAAAFRYSRDTVENDTVDANEQFGLRLRNGTVELLLGAGNWQALTDPGTATITAFRVVPTVHELDLADSCADCLATCDPHQQVRSVEIVLAARSALDATVVRTLRSEVRVRNDAVTGACAP
jgi:prepilin peptidase dependent protein B